MLKGWSRGLLTTDLGSGVDERIKKHSYNDIYHRVLETDAATTTSTIQKQNMFDYWGLRVCKFPFNYMLMKGNLAIATDFHAASRDGF